MPASLPMVSYSTFGGWLFIFSVAGNWLMGFSSGGARMLAARSSAFFPRAFHGSQSPVRALGLFAGFLLLQHFLVRFHS